MNRRRFAGIILCLGLPAKFMAQASGSELSAPAPIESSFHDSVQQILVQRKHPDMR